MGLLTDVLNYSIVFDWEISKDYNWRRNVARDKTEPLRWTELSIMLQGT